MDYSREVSRRFANPSGYGQWRTDAGKAFHGSAEDRTQGVWVRFDVQLHEQNIAAIRFQTFGCPHAVAAASLVAERALGHPPGALLEIEPHRVMEALEVPVDKLGRVLVVEDAARACWTNIDQGTKEE